MGVATEKLKVFGELHNLLNDVTTSENCYVSGSLIVTETTLPILLRATDVDLVMSGCVVFRTDSLSIRDYGKRLAERCATVNLSLVVPKHAYQDWDDLFSNQDNRLEIPDCFMIINDRYCIYSHDDNHPFVNSYRTIVNLIGYLKDVADHENSETSLVYLGHSKLTIDIIYNKKTLENLNSFGFDVFTETMHHQEHAKQKKYILKEVLFNMLLQIAERERFNSLLDRLQEFLMHCEHGYRLFVTSFSFDNVRREYEEKYRDYNSKLNSSINDVATKALATPVTLLFSISNISATSTAVSNYSIAVSSILVSTLMLFLVKSNSDNLQAIEDEYTSIFKRLALELVTDVNGETRNKCDVEKLKDKLDNRVATSQNLNKITIISTIASSLFVIGYLLWLTW